MVIDYQHPIFQAMRRTYNDAREFDELVWEDLRNWKSSIPEHEKDKIKPPQDIRSALSESASRLGAAEKKILKFIQEIEYAEDLPLDERTYYASHMAHYREGVLRWQKKVEDFLTDKK
ncbi:MAG: hypothetical protein AABW58_04240 [Nanoarchaeota archaeon]